MRIFPNSVSTLRIKFEKCEKNASKKSFQYREDLVFCQENDGKEVAKRVLSSGAPKLESDVYLLYNKSLI